MCLQTHGGFGFAAEYEVERKFRETRLYQVAPVSTNLILSYIAEHVLGLPRSFCALGRTRSVADAVRRPLAAHPGRRDPLAAYASWRWNKPSRRPFAPGSSPTSARTSSRSSAPTEAISRARYDGVLHGRRRTSPG